MRIKTYDKPNIFLNSMDEPETEEKEEKELVAEPVREKVESVEEEKKGAEEVKKEAEPQKEVNK